MSAALGGRRVRALLLDLDNTILDNRNGLLEAWDSVAALVVGAHSDLDRSRVSAELRRVTTWFWSDPERERSGRLDLAGARRLIVERALEAVGRSDAPLAERAARHYGELREATLRPLDGAHALLARLRSRVPRMALVTNGAAEPQRAKVRRFELEPYFDHILIEGEFGVGKPERRVYEHVLGRLGAGPEEGLMVGDNFDCDVVGALEAGMTAVWIDPERSGRPPRSAPRPFLTLGSIHELPGLLDG